MTGVSLDSFTTFGELLKYLRKRARLTQRELGLAVGYSEAQVNRLESGQRLPDVTAVRSQFVSALGLDREPEAASRLLALAGAAHTSVPASGAGHTATPSSRAPQLTNLPQQLTRFIGRE